MILDDTCPILRMLDFLPFLQVTSPSESGMAIENPNQSQSPSSSSLQSLNPSALMVNTPAMALATIKPDTRVMSFMQYVGNLILCITI